MKQHEAVIIALEKLGGQSTLANLYRETMKVEGCKNCWKQKPLLHLFDELFNNVQRFSKFGPGLWALKSIRKNLDLLKTLGKDKSQVEQNAFLLSGDFVINWKFAWIKTFSPNQDKNRLFVK